MPTSFTSKVGEAAVRDDCPEFTIVLMSSCRDGLYLVDETGRAVMDHEGVWIWVDNWPTYTEVNTASCRD